LFGFELCLTLPDKEKPRAQNTKEYNDKNNNFPLLTLTATGSPAA